MFSGGPHSSLPGPVRCLQENKARLFTGVIGGWTVNSRHKLKQETFRLEIVKRKTWEKHNIGTG